ncbi:MAG: DNA polymerase [Desulfomonilaceae bacterium]
MRSLIGREVWFPRWPSLEKEHQFRVTWPQQIEADLIKTAMVRLDRIFRRRNMRARIVMIIQDSIWVEAPHRETEQVRHLMRRMITTAGKLNVPPAVEFEQQRPLAVQHLKKRSTDQKLQRCGIEPFSFRWAMAPG